MPTVRPRTTIYLWEFLLQLLDGEETCAAISWVNRERGEFVLKDQSEIAKLWGKVKGRPRMDKIKLGRAMRYYYKKKLLAKVPRRKAVYRFTKFDYLKQKESETIRHEDYPEIDFSDNSILDVICDDKSEGGSSLPAEVDGDEDDTPLESLLAEKNQQEFQQEKCQKLGGPMEENRNSYENMNRSGSTCNSFYDYNNATSFPNQNEDYYVPCSEVNTHCEYGRQNYHGYIRNSAFEPVNYDLQQCYYPQVNLNNNYQQCDVESGGHLASLLLNSILISDQQFLQDTSNLRETCSVPVPCVSTAGNITPELITSPTLAQIKCEQSHNSLSPAQLQDLETDAAWSTLKEFERLLMINRSF